MEKTIHDKQEKLTDKLLFDYYLISSAYEREIYTPFPFYLDKTAFDEMVEASRVLDGLVMRITENFIKESRGQLIRFDNFSMKDKVFGLNIPILPFFWVRYDAFQREQGGIFFSEFNYDKPCAQREIAVSAAITPHNNPNSRFQQDFKTGFDNIIRSFFKGSRKQKPRVAILADSCHYEEVHLAFLYCDILGTDDYDFIIAGAKNISVREGKAYAFDLETDIILRQYPTEFLDEVENFEALLDLYEQGKVLVINDPRAIIGQTKSLFAYLWELADTDSPFITKAEKRVITNTIPRTQYFTREHLPELYKNKDAYVVKAAFGRYSEEVYIGRMHSDEEWKETLDYVSESDKIHLVQEFCQIKREKILRYIDNRFYEEDAFGNFGIYLVNSKFSGICARWSCDYLSHDDGVWISPVGIREKSLKVRQYLREDRQVKWDKINDAAAFGWGYTGGYTGLAESFSLDSLILYKELYEELKTASEELGRIVKNTVEFAKENYQVFYPVLGISDKLTPLINRNYTDSLTLIGRLDWVIDSKGSLKLLEFNSETPAGLMESLVINELVFRETEPDVGLKNPNKHLEEAIRSSFDRIISDYKRVKEINTIGFVTSAYSEDWYNTTIISGLLKQSYPDIISGDISNLAVKGDKLYMFGVPLDAVYRYYPLDWFLEDSRFEGVIDALLINTLSINPPLTLISQSKAFFALVWELLDNGFYNPTDEGLIKRYIPRTALTSKKIVSRDFCTKPFFGREGEQIGFSIDNSYKALGKNDVVFQERVDIQPVNLNMHTVLDSEKKVCYPVIGAYLAGEKFCGVYTRAGNRVTDKSAVFLPAFVC